MRRREFIGLVGGTAVSFPFAAHAQQPKPATVAILNFQNPEPFQTMLRDGLRDMGYTEGGNLRLEVRSAEGNRERLAGFVAELVRLKPNAVIAYPTPATLAMMQATSDIPIVMVGSGDPVATGLVTSLARPGGNVTGTSSTNAETGAKTLEIIRDIIPSLRRVAVLANATDAFTKTFLEQLQLGAQALRLELVPIMIKSAEELEPAIADMKKNAVDAILVQPSLPRNRVAELALKHRIPAIAPAGAFAAIGGLAAYTASQPEMARRSVATVDKILKGSKPADVPVEQPTTFVLSLNLKTAKALGIEISPVLLGRADEVIE